MLTYDQIQVTVRSDNVTSLIFRMNEGYDGFSFYAETTQLCAFLRGGRDANGQHAPDMLRDVFRVAMRFMERITFCDLGRAMEKGDSRPKLELEVYNMSLPLKVGAILADRIEAAVPAKSEEGAYASNEVRFEITTAERAHWAGMYGIGKGSVRIEFTNDDVKNKFEAKLAEYAGVVTTEAEATYAKESDVQKAARTFGRSLSSLKSIAKNTTLQATDVGILRIGPDWAGFTFTAGGFFGGLIFHESSGEWSVHT